MKIHEHTKQAGKGRYPHASSSVGIIIAVITAALFFPQPLPAETITLETVRQAAVENSRLIKNAELDTASKEIDEKQVVNQWLPTLSASASLGYGHSSSTAGSEEITTSKSSSIGLSLSQPVYKGGVYKLEKENAAVETGIAKTEYDAVVLEVLNTADTYYLDYLKAVSAGETAEREYQAVKVLLEIADGKMEYGGISRSEYLEIQADTAEKKAAMQKAQATMSIAGTRLASYMGVTGIDGAEDIGIREYDSVIRLLSEMTDKKITETTEKLTACGMNLSPSLMAAELNLRKTRLQAEKDVKEYAPSISISVSERLTGNGEYDLSNSGTLSISASVSLLQWDRKGVKEQAAIQIRQAGNTREETIREYLLEIQSVWLDLIASARETVSSKAGLEYTEELYKLVLEQYRLSSVPYSDLADAEVRLSGGREAYLSARYTFLENLSGLSAALGYEDWDMLWEILGI